MGVISQHKNSISSSEDLNLEFVDPGTIKIDCSGAYIANDHLLKQTIILRRGSENSSTDENNNTTSTSSSEESISRTPSPEIQSESNPNSYSEEEDDINNLTPKVDEQVSLPPNLDKLKVDNVSNGGIDLSRHEHAIVDGDYDYDEDDDQYDLTKNITLPRHNSEIIHISVDIGGTLTKLIYFTKSFNSYGGKLHFKDFQTENFKHEVLKFLIKLIQKSINKQQQQQLSPNKSSSSSSSIIYPPITYIMATGGGAHKFYQLMTKTFKKHGLPMKIIAKDEMECLIKGLNWLITKIPNEIFTYDLEEHNTKFISNSLSVNKDSIFPYLLVNIGSGVSMIKVIGPGPDQFERIGGSSLGGGTLWGLLSLLTDAKDYTEMLEMAERGNNENVDLLVGDIYGTNYGKIGLKANHIASSFAKVFKKLRFNNKSLTPAEKLSQFKPEDIARSLLYSVSNNIGQIAYLQACRFNLKSIYFGGSFISGHKQTIHTLSYAVNFWSGGEMTSFFLRHEGYLGSVGAFMMGPNIESIKNNSINGKRNSNSLST
ncbi:fumble-domain-containing protein [Scheffersomyces coipomensis]|uniref:fumble-domain-containing protein n=1 Tax=Scheffersomyces coipomensis TaxID=1788519 RepID=UPI00315D3D95